MWFQLRTKLFLRCMLRMSSCMKTYMKPLTLLPHPPRYSYCLRKALCGLKEAQKAFFATYINVTVTFRFMQDANDTSLLLRCSCRDKSASFKNKFSILIFPFFLLTNNKGMSSSFPHVTRR